MNENGLNTQQAQHLLIQYGQNLLPEKSSSSIISLLLSQYRNSLSLILFVSSLLAFVIGDKVDGYLIMAVLVFNGFLGFWQEYKASKELESLRELEVDFSRVIRDAKQVKIPSSNLVPGDIVLLDGGDKIPADGVVIQSFDLMVNESSLTGESLPIIKSVADKENRVYFATSVISGQARVKIEQTGLNTRFGKLALNLTEIKEEPTPLEILLRDLTFKITIIAFLIAGFLFIVKFYQKEPILEIFFSSIALMVAAVPEGLPTAITLLLAIGVRRMSKKNAIVRRMDSLESLGATSVICADKTGTITQNKMSVREVFNVSSEIDLSEAAVYCNSATLVQKEDHGSFDILGDNTEGALLIWAKEKGREIATLKSQAKLIEELPFESKSKMMSVLLEKDGILGIFTKGAPESVIPLCNLSNKDQEEYTRHFEQMAGKGLRVLAFAKKTAENGKKLSEQLSQLHFLGLIGIADPPREEAREAIQKAKQAGIKIVMVTGDNELTAKVIAEEVGLLTEGDEILLGNQLAELTDEQLMERIEKVRIFARIVPEDKLRIVKAYQSNNEVVAVTGDGVNDALALKQAHVGVAMGRGGTDVAKEASDIVIVDDNLATIVDAIEQGRIVYANVLKVFRFLLTTNLSEVLVIVGAVIAGLPTPLLAAQILWINLVGDGLPALSLAADGSSNNIMKQPPRPRTENLLDIQNLRYILVFGFIIASLNLALYATILSSSGIDSARSIVFSFMVFSQLLFIFFVRKHQKIFSNKYLWGSVLVVSLVQILIITNPVLKSFFKL